MVEHPCKQVAWSNSMTPTMPETHARAQVPGSVIAQQDMYLLWKPRTMAEVTPASLAFLDLIKPAPEILVVGCGLTAQPLPPDVAKHLKERGIKAEVLDSVGGH